MKVFRTIVVAGFSAFLGCSIAAQQTPQPTQEAPRTKKPAAKPAPRNAHKVWSNDNIATLRTPEDKYVEAKVASPVAPAAQPPTPAVTSTPSVPTASAAPVKSAALPSTSIKLPDTIEKTQQVIRENTQDIHDAEDRLRQLKSELTATPEPQKTQKQAEIERTAKLIADAEADLKTLQDHLQKLRATESAKRTSSPQ